MTPLDEDVPELSLGEELDEQAAEDGSDTSLPSVYEGIEDFLERFGE